MKIEEKFLKLAIKRTVVVFLVTGLIYSAWSIGKSGKESIKKDKQDELTLLSTPQQYRYSFTMTYDVEKKLDIDHSTNSGVVIVRQGNSDPLLFLLDEKDYEKVNEGKTYVFVLDGVVTSNPSLINDVKEHDAIAQETFRNNVASNSNVAILKETTTDGMDYPSSSVSFGPTVYASK